MALAAWGPLPRPPFCSFLATAADPSPNFGGGVRAKCRARRQARMTGACSVFSPLPRSLRERGRG
jgi:hypothetical protein